MHRKPHSSPYCTKICQHSKKDIRYRKMHSASLQTFTTPGKFVFKHGRSMRKCKKQLNEGKSNFLLGQYFKLNNSENLRLSVHNKANLLWIRLHTNKFTLVSMVFCCAYQQLVAIDAYQIAANRVQYSFIVCLSLA